jgi:hypothetical protein
MSVPHSRPEKDSDVHTDPESSSAGDLPASVGGVDDARLLRKIDLRVLPFICVMYLLAFLDRYVCMRSRGGGSLTPEQRQHLECIHIRAPEGPRAHGLAVQ